MSVVTENSAHTASDQQLKRVVIASMVGSFIEWYEFAVYGYLAVIMGQVFFPNGDAATQIIASFATFAVAFIARPFGGFIFGWMGDKFGRKRALNLTLVLMTVSTFLIGLIPSYQSAGIIAPIILIFFRLIQGFSGGGEASGAAIFVAEHCRDDHRTLMTSWVELGCMAGFVFGAALSAVMRQVFTPEELVEWAWRLPYFFSAPLAYIGIYIRNRLEESPHYVAAVSEHRAGKSSFSWGELAKHKGAMFRSAGLMIANNIGIFIVLTYMPTWLVSTLNLSPANSFIVGIFPMLFVLILIPVFAKIADRIGRKKIMMIGSVGMIIFALPCFYVLQEGSIAMKFVAMVILNICPAFLLSSILAKVPSLFPIHIRFTGMAVSYNVAVALFAGTAPMINAWLISVTGNHYIPAYYLIAGSLIGVITLLFTKDLTGKPMPESE